MPYLVLAEAGQSALDSSAKEDEVGGIQRKSTRVWALETGYDAEKLFNKVFELSPKEMKNIYC